MTFDFRPGVLALALAFGLATASRAEPAARGAGLSPLVQSHTGHPAGQTRPKPKEREQEKEKPGGPPKAEETGAGVPREPIPPITEADREAAFPDVQGHSVHDRAIHYFVLFDQLEWQWGGGETGGSWDSKGWVGGDINRFWFRAEGEGEGGSVNSAQAHALYGRAIARWWDLVLGIRQDVRPGPAQTWAAIGIQGLAPYWFEVEATASIGAGGRTHLRLETEYELLLTNRLILQPLVEVEIYGKRDPEREIGAGLSTVETGARLRYEVRREFAPYMGVTWSRMFFGTATLAREAGEDVSGTRLALGARIWF